MSPQIKTALIAVLSAIIGALGGWASVSAPLTAIPVACPVCPVCSVVVEAPPVVAPAEVAPVGAVVVPVAAPLHP